MNYLELVAMLPVPTLEQTTRFAEHVANNHSWYKHLPFYPPGALFVIFPNPQAGRCVEADGDRFVVSDIDSGNYFSHHSRLTTQDYRDQFGHWDYWVDENPRVAKPVIGPWIYWIDGGRRELLADCFKKWWSCRLTAFLKPLSSMFELRPSQLVRESDEFAVYAKQRQADVEIARYRGIDKTLRCARDVAWGNHDVIAFMKTEAKEQRERLLATLQRVRSDWGDVRRSRAAPEICVEPGDAEVTGEA